MQTNEDQSLSRPFRVRSAGDLGLAVRHFRVCAGVTQAELAARVGLHRTYLSELENGHSTDAVVRLMDLFRELGVRVTISPEQW